MAESFHHRSFRLALGILRLHRTILTNVEVPRHLANQLCRAGTAIGANREEARSAYSRRDLARYTIALREGRECHYWLRLLKEDQPKLASATDPLIDEVHQLIAMLTAAVIELRKATPSSDTSTAQ